MSEDAIRAEVEYQVERARFELEQKFEARHADDIAVLQERAENYRSALTWFSGGLGALLLGVVVTWAEGRIDAGVRERTETIAEAVRAEVTQDIAGVLAEERALSTLLPLAVGEAIDLDDDTIERGINSYAEELVIQALTEIGPAVEDLDGYVFDLAARRIERILDSFWRHGRHYEMHRVFSSFTPDLQQSLLAHRSGGILFTMADGLASEILQDGQLPQSRADILAQVRRQEAEPDSPTRMAQAALDLFLVANEAGWGSDEMVATLSLQADQWNAYVGYLYSSHLCPARSSLPANPDLFGVQDTRRDDRLRAVTEQISDLDLAFICSFRAETGLLPWQN